MKQWSVASSIIEQHRGRDASDGPQADPSYLLVANRRRNNSIDWSPAGGVVDPGESALYALTREVAEETGLTVDGWEALAYEVEVRFLDLEMHLTVVTHRATSWSGAVAIDDPDGIVEEVQWRNLAGCKALLADAPVWVRQPFLAAIESPAADAGPQRWTYEVRGERLADAEVVHVESDA